jgi:hypothetical protein
MKMLKFLPLALLMASAAFADVPIAPLDQIPKLDKDPGNYEVSFDKVPAKSMARKTIYFDKKVTPFAQWGGADKAVLNLHSAFVEPTIKEQTGTETYSMVKEDITVYQTQTKVIVELPATAIKLERFLDIEQLKKMNPTDIIQSLNASDVKSSAANDTEGLMAFRNPPAPAPQWCTGPNQVCVNSRFKLIPGINAFMGVAIWAKNKFTKKQSDSKLASQDEIRINRGSEIKDPTSLKKLTGIETDVIATVTVTGFWFTHAAQFAKSVMVIQSHPTDSQKTIVTTLSAFGLETKWWTNTMPTAFAPLMEGVTIANITTGISRGIPYHAQEIANATAQAMEAR